MNIMLLLTFVLVAVLIALSEQQNSDNIIGSIYAGGGTDSSLTTASPTSANFSKILSIYPVGNDLYFAAYGKQAIFKISGDSYALSRVSGLVDQAGFRDGANLNEAKFNSPHSVVVVGSYIYVSDSVNCAIRQIVSWYVFTPSTNIGCGVGFLAFNNKDNRLYATVNGVLKYYSIQEERSGSVDSPYSMTFVKVSTGYDGIYVLTSSSEIIRFGNSWERLGPAIEVCPDIESSTYYVVNYFSAYTYSKNVISKCSSYCSYYKTLVPNLDPTALTGLFMTANKYSFLRIYNYGNQAKIYSFVLEATSSPSFQPTKVAIDKSISFVVSLVSFLRICFSFYLHQICFILYVLSPFFC